MTMKALFERVYLPSFFTGAASPSGPTASSILNTAGGREGWEVSIPRTGSIRRIGFVFNGVLGAAGNMSLRIETVSAVDGYPTGNLIDPNAFAIFPAATGIVWIDLAADVPVVAGTYVAVVLTNVSGYTAPLTNSYDTSVTRPAYFTITAANVKTKSTNRPPFVMEYSDGVCMMSDTGLIATSTSSVSTGPAGIRQIGNRFKLPFGARIRGGYAVATGQRDWRARLYGPDGATVLRIADIGIQDAVNSSISLLTFAWEDIDLAADTFYRIIIQNTTPAVAKNIASMDTPADARFRQARYAGPDWYATKSNLDAPVGDASWTDEVYRINNIGIHLAGIDIPEMPAGGGVITSMSSGLSIIGG
jgi:hypothetical protein